MSAQVFIRFSLSTTETFSCYISTSYYHYIVVYTVNDSVEDLCFVFINFQLRGLRSLYVFSVFYSPFYFSVTFMCAISVYIS